MNKDKFKFRVWDNTKNQYVDNSEVELLLNGDGVLLFGNWHGDVHFAEGNYIIEQCTGLKDKNDNLIYEGDIVIGRKEIVVCEMIKYKDVVEYKDGEYFPFNWTGVYKPEKFEIIGNIHEQAEHKA